MRFRERHEGSALPTRRDDSLFLSMHLPGVLCFLFSIRHVPKYTGRRMGYCMLSRAICLHSRQFEPAVLFSGEGERVASGNGDSSHDEFSLVGWGLL